jgi:protein NirF
LNVRRRQIVDTTARRMGRAEGAADRLGFMAPLRVAVTAAALLLIGTVAQLQAANGELRGTADLGIVVERAAGRVQVVDTTARRSLGAVEGLGDLSHAHAVYSRDGRYAYVFGRDGGLTKVDLLTRRIDRRIVQAGNSIGGSIS